MADLNHDCFSFDIMGRCRECGADCRELAEALQEAVDDAMPDVIRAMRTVPEMAALMDEGCEILQMHALPRLPADSNAE